MAIVKTETMHCTVCDTDGTVTFTTTTDGFESKADGCQHLKELFPDKAVSLPN